MAPVEPPKVLLIFARDLEKYVYDLATMRLQSMSFSQPRLAFFAEIQVSLLVHTVMCINIIMDRQIVLVFWAIFAFIGCKIRRNWPIPVISGTKIA